MTAIFRVLQRPFSLRARKTFQKLRFQLLVGKLIRMDPSRRRTPPPFDLAAMTTVERVLLAYVLRGKPLTRDEHASLVRLCRVSTSGA